MTSPMITRHSGAGIFIHWFNALCWLFLLASGLGLIDNPALQPLGQGYPKALRALLGGGANLLLAHWLVALIWLTVWLGFALMYLGRYVIPFVRQVFSLQPRRDLEWMIKKNLQMTVGYHLMAKLIKPLGLDGRIPDQEYYNAGQKLAAQALLLGGLTLVASGLVMLASKYLLGGSAQALVQWSITIHYLAAMVTTAMLILHVYMAAISRDERPALFSMFSGQVPEEYARHHHKLWYDQIRDSNSGS